MLKYIQLLNSKNKNLKQDIDKMFDIEKELGFVDKFLFKHFNLIYIIY